MRVFYLFCKLFVPNKWAVNAQENLGFFQSKRSIPSARAGVAREQNEGAVCVNKIRSG